MLAATSIRRATIGAARQHSLPSLVVRAQAQPNRSVATTSSETTTTPPAKRSVVADIVLRAKRATSKLQNLPPETPVDDLKLLIRKGDGRRAFDKFRQLANEEKLDGFWIRDYNELLRLQRQTATGTGGVDIASNRVRNSEYILQIMRSKGYQPSVHTWSAIATTYALLGRVDKVDEVINKAGHAGFKLRHGPVIRLLALTRNSPIEALKQFEEKIEADPERSQEVASVYNRLLAQFSGAADRERFSRLLALGRKHGIVPDGGTYDVLINHFAVTVGNMEEARKMMDQRVAYKLGRTTRGYNALLRGYLLKKEWANFHATMEEMDRNGVPYNNTTFNIVMTMHAALKQPVMAMQAYFKMFANQVPVTPKTRAVLARAATHYDGSIRSLILAGGGMPSSAMFSTLIKGAIEEREFQFSLRIIDEYRECKQRGFKMTSAILVKELSCWARLNRVDRAEQMLENAWKNHGFAPDAWAYNQMILMYCRTETLNADKAFATYQRMLTETSNPAAVNIAVFTALLIGVWKHGQPVEGRALWTVRECVARELVEAKRATDSPICDAIEAIGDGDFSKGLEMVQKDVAAGFSFPQGVEDGEPVANKTSPQEGEPLDAADVKPAALRPVSGSTSSAPDQASVVPDGEPLDAADTDAQVKNSFPQGAESGEPVASKTLPQEGEPLDAADVKTAAPRPVKNSFQQGVKSGEPVANKTSPQEGEPLDAADVKIAAPRPVSGSTSSAPDQASVVPDGEPLDAADADAQVKTS
ncbi:hypothetical protein HDU89_003521 [Geranomyces variabilis]|nr:hypothetical protein HDU89_003521 [Geranomyces variabilis]